MNRIVQFNPEVAVRVLATVAQNQGLPVAMLHEPLTKVIAQMYQLGFMVCGNPDSPQVQSVASQYGVQVQPVARVNTAERPRALQIPAGQLQQPAPAQPTAAMVAEPPLPALNPAASPIAGDAPSM